MAEYFVADAYRILLTMMEPYDHPYRLKGFNDGVRAVFAIMRRPVRAEMSDILARMNDAQGSMFKAAGWRAAAKQFAEMSDLDFDKKFDAMKANIQLVDQARDMLIRGVGGNPDVHVKKEGPEAPAPIVVETDSEPKAEEEKADE